MSMWQVSSAVDPLTGEATQPYFELTIDLAAGSGELLRHGMTSRVRLRG